RAVGIKRDGPIALRRVTGRHRNVLRQRKAEGVARRNRLGGQIEVRQQCAQDKDGGPDIRRRMFLVCVQSCAFSSVSLIGFCSTCTLLFITGSTGKTSARR